MDCQCTKMSSSPVPVFSSQVRKSSSVTPLGKYTLRPSGTSSCQELRLGVTA